MGIDIRLPLGLLFTTLGVLLSGYGALSEKGIYERSLGLNVNLAWGSVLLVFGIVMVVLGSRRRNRGSSGPQNQTAERNRDR